MFLLWSGISLVHWDYIPIWDGWSFFTCYLQFARENHLECYGHIADAHVLLFGLTQKLFPDSFQAVYALNLVLGGVGLWCFRRWLNLTAGPRIGPINVTLVVFSFAFSPVFLAHTIQPCLDYTLPLFLVMLLLALHRDSTPGILLSGVGMVFTKEPGCLLYGLTVVFWTLAGLPGAGEGRIFSWPTGRQAFVRFLPLLLFGLFLLDGGKSHMNLSWAEQIWWLFHVDLSDPRLKMQLSGLLLLNFHWVGTVVMVLACLHTLHRWFFGDPTPAAGALPPAVFRFVLCLFCAGVVLLTRVLFVNNPRYLLPLYPLFFVLAADGAARLVEGKKAFTVVFAVLICLETASCFRTLDPVSKWITGTFSFGDHEMLNMARNDYPPRLGKTFLPEHFGYGRDQLSYNFEYTRFSLLLDGAISQIGPGRVFAVPYRAFFRDDYDHFDPRRGRHCHEGPDSVPLRMKFTRQILLKPERYPEVWYLALPNFRYDDNVARDIASLSLIFRHVETKTFTLDGYHLPAFRFVGSDANSPPNKGMEGPLQLSAPSP